MRIVSRYQNKFTRFLSIDCAFADTDTSVLYGAYVAGLILTYISQPAPGEDSDETANELSFEQTFGRTIDPLQAYLFLPLFFASIGFAVVSSSLCDAMHERH